MANMMRRSQRAAVKLKIGMSGASGSGKTMSSLLLAYGLIHAQHPELTDDEIWSRVCVIDTENGSADLYSDHTVGRFTIGEFNKIDLSAPFTPAKYQDAIDCCEDNGIEVCIIDSLSHAWAGEGGLLDKQQRIAATGKNSYTAWRDVTPDHNRLVDKMMQCKMHVIADMRTKTEYVLEDNGKGKQVPKKIGMAPIFRDGIEYEFTIVFDISPDHYATASKDRTGIFDGQSFVIGPDIGQKINEWLRDGAPQKEQKVEMNKVERSVKPVTTGDVKPTPVMDEEPEEEVTPPDPALDDEDELPFGSEPVEDEDISLDDFITYIRGLVKTATAEEKTQIGDTIRRLNNGSAKFKEITDGAIRTAICNELKTTMGGH